MAFLSSFRRTIPLLSFAMVFGTLSGAEARDERLDEYRVKAALLFNFAKFVDWPTQTFNTAKDPIVICVLGKNPFGNVLEETIGGKEVEGRTFVVRQVPDIQPGCACQILFVNSSEEKRFRTMAEKLKGAAILTVGETQGFIADGGVINFKLENGRVRFEINPEAAERQRLRISSKLLSLAQVVKR